MKTKRTRSRTEVDSTTVKNTTVPTFRSCSLAAACFILLTIVGRVVHYNSTASIIHYTLL